MKKVSLNGSKTVLMEYSNDYLIEKIKEHIEKDTTYLKDVFFEFSNSVVRVTGTIWEDWDIIEGDYWTPPEYNFISRVADFEEIIYSDEHGDRALTLEEITYIEEQLKKE